MDRSISRAASLFELPDHCTRSVPELSAITVISLGAAGAIALVPPAQAQLVGSESPAEAALAVIAILAFAGAAYTLERRGRVAAAD